MRALKTFGRFWYDFVVGDDPKIAAGVLLVLVVGAVLAAAGQTSAAAVLLLGLGLGLAFSVSMLVDVRAHRQPRH